MNVITSQLIEEIQEQLFRLRGSGDTHKQKSLRASLRNARLQIARSKGTHTEEQWLAKLAEFQYRCVRCGCIPVGRPCKDHIKPIIQGGSDHIKNLQPLCRECNSEKCGDSFNWCTFRRKHGFKK